METEAAILWDGEESGASSRLSSTRPRRVRSSSGWPRRACATPTSTSSRATCRSRCPMIGGHEGAGVIEEVGPGVTRPGAGRPRRAGLRPGLRQVPAVRHRPLQPLRRGRRPHGRPADGRHPAPPRPGPGRRHHGLPRHLRPLHGGEPGLVREDPRRHPPREGLPRRVRRDHRLGLGGLRRRRAARATTSP